MLLHITHVTLYDYAPGVDTAQHMAHLQPPDTPYQTCISHQLDVEPPCSDVDTRLDAFGNHRSYWAMSSFHQQLRVRAHSVLRTHSPQEDLLDAMVPTTKSTMSWEAARDLYCYASGQAGDAASEFSYPSHHAPVDAAFAAYASPSFGEGRPLAAAACELMERIYRDFAYESLSTEISTPALEVLQERRGVCQDFAHVLLACLRSLGLAARYVSGYLLTEPPPGQPRLTGADASHAWVSVYLPDLGGARGLPHGGWLDLDPTNNRSGLGTPGSDYVRLAVGRDFADVSPLRGVLQGGANHTLTVRVTVAPAMESI